MIVVGSRILTGVSMVDIMAYVCGLAMDITKLVSYEDVSLRRCEMIKEPSGVGMSVGGAVAYSDVILLVEESYEVAAAIPPINDCTRKPWGVFGSCADMLGRGTAVEDCTTIAVRH